MLRIVDPGQLHGSDSLLEGSQLGQQRGESLSANSFQQCRAMGHSWVHQKAIEQRHSATELGLLSVCSNCGTARTKWLARSGMSLGNSYSYPEGYSLHGDDRLPNQEWRSLYVSSLFPDKPKGKKKAA